MQKLPALAAALLIGLPTSVAADDIWDGFYVGAQIGYADAKTSIVGNRFTYNQNSNPNIVDHEYDGALVGGYVGWNRQYGDFVIGGELALSLTDLASDLVFNSDNDIDEVDISSLGALTARAGYTKGRTLGYVRAGLAFADISNLGGDVNSGVLTESDAHRRDDVRVGATVGIGAERFISDQWIARIEFSYTEFESYEEANDDGAPGSQVYTIDNGPIRAISFGISRKF